MQPGIFFHMQRLLSWWNTGMDSAIPSPSSRLSLFGGSKTWNSSTVSWTAVDDRVRGGSSQSYLAPIENSTHVLFYGHLDTQTLGGAGFASQTTTGDGAWDLSFYEGLQVEVGQGDGKRYTLIVKDEVPDGRREDGREKAGVSWEYDFVPGDLATTRGGKTGKWETISIPWSDFHATYRGREKKDATPLRTGQIKRFSLMMRSFFELQEGDFKIEVRSISAFKAQGI